MSYVPSSTVLTFVVHEASFTVMTKALFFPVSPHSCGLAEARACAFPPPADGKSNTAASAVAAAQSS
jgi:hypothetical protein